MLLAVVGGLIQYRWTGGINTEKDILNMEAPLVLRLASYARVLPCYKRPVDEVPLLDVMALQDE